MVFAMIPPAEIPSVKEEGDHDDQVTQNSSSSKRRKSKKKKKKKIPEKIQQQVGLMKGKRRRSNENITYDSSAGVAAKEGILNPEHTSYHDQEIKRDSSQAEDSDSEDESEDEGEQESSLIEEELQELHKQVDLEVDDLDALEGLFKADMERMTQGLEAEANLYRQQESVDSYDYQLQEEHDTTSAFSASTRELLEQDSFTKIVPSQSDLMSVHSGDDNQPQQDNSNDESSDDNDGFVKELKSMLNEAEHRLAVELPVSQGSTPPMTTTPPPPPSAAALPTASSSNLGTPTPYSQTKSPSSRISSLIDMFESKSGQEANRKLAMSSRSHSLDSTKSNDTPPTSQTPTHTNQTITTTSTRMPLLMSTDAGKVNETVQELDARIIQRTRSYSNASSSQGDEDLDSITRQSGIDDTNNRSVENPQEPRSGEEEEIYASAGFDQTRHHSNSSSRRQRTKAPRKKKGPSLADFFTANQPQRGKRPDNKNNKGVSDAASTTTNSVATQSTATVTQTETTSVVTSTTHTTHTGSVTTTATPPHQLMESSTTNLLTPTNEESTTTKQPLANNQNSNTESASQRPTAPPHPPAKMDGSSAAAELATSTVKSTGVPNNDTVSSTGPTAAAWTSLGTLQTPRQPQRQPNWRPASRNDDSPPAPPPKKKSFGSLFGLSLKQVKKQAYRHQSWVVPALSMVVANLVCPDSPPVSMAGPSMSASGFAFFEFQV